MQTRSKPQPPSRLGRRQTPAPQGRFGRPSTPTRRKAPQQSTTEKALSAVTGALGGASSAKGGKGKTKAKAGGKGNKGKMALLAGGLGLAMKNRGKIEGLLGRRKANKTAAQSATPAPPPPPPHVPGA
jgi:hypothetical protein